ncbi:hypothetical protein HNR46_003401 [Haloferula luteola]|uniref:Uncharacterized protein n=1 Tax=Haloferula luteola TaxID=595692 RepID=A0A840V4D2_9BACT|nr:hypothetical protein [Haloferula luteola]
MQIPETSNDEQTPKQIPRSIFVLSFSAFCKTRIILGFNHTFAFSCAKRL